MKLNSLIWTKENALSPKFCQHVIDKFESDDRVVVGNTLYGITDHKKSTDLYISHFSDWKDEDKVFYESLNTHLKKYLDHCNSLNYYIEGTSKPGLHDVGYQIQRTKPGEYYRWHHDFVVNHRGIRYITFIWYLNDIHEDGYTEFLNGPRIKPKTGKILFFPATWTYVHRGVSPISETKYICTGWLHSRSGNHE